MIGNKRNFGTTRNRERGWVRELNENNEDLPEADEFGNISDTSQRDKEPSVSSSAGVQDGDSYDSDEPRAEEVENEQKGKKRKLYAWMDSDDEVTGDDEVEEEEEEDPELAQDLVDEVPEGQSTTSPTIQNPLSISPPIDSGDVAPSTDSDKSGTVEPDDAKKKFDKSLEALVRCVHITNLDYKCKIADFYDFLVNTGMKEFKLIEDTKTPGGKIEPITRPHSGRVFVEFKSFEVLIVS